MEIGFLAMYNIDFSLIKGLLGEGRNTKKAGFSVRFFAPQVGLEPTTP